MRIHTDKLKMSDLFTAVADVDAKAPAIGLRTITRYGSKSRDHAFVVVLRGHGARHTRYPNTGTRGAASVESVYEGMAATRDDWGHWFARLYEQDPDMIVTGYYKNELDFHRRTANKYASK
jgi:hypothetical protein